MSNLLCKLPFTRQNVICHWLISHFPTNISFFDLYFRDKFSSVKDEKSRYSRRMAVGEERRENFNAFQLNAFGLSASRHVYSSLYWVEWSDQCLLRFSIVSNDQNINTILSPSRKLDFVACWLIFKCVPSRSLILSEMSVFINIYLYCGGLTP